MTVPALTTGLRHSLSVRVGNDLTVPSMSDKFSAFADMPAVFSTAYMVGFMEWTCIEALKPYLAEGLKTVGTHVDLSHSAATPVGMTVTMEVELVAIEGKKLRFNVVGRDEADTICEGMHERFIIDAAKFNARIQQKAAASAG